MGVALMGIASSRLLLVSVSWRENRWGLGHVGVDEISCETAPIPHEIAPIPHEIAPIPQLLRDSAYSSAWLVLSETACCETRALCGTGPILPTRMVTRIVTRIVTRRSRPDPAK